MLLAFRLHALMFIRACHRLAQSLRHASSAIIPSAFLSELTFWSNLDSAQLTSPIGPPLFCAEVQIHCDAGATGWAGVLGKHSAHGFFPAHVQHNISSSTLREVSGIFHALESFLPLIRNESVQLFTDSHNAIFILQRKL